MSFHINFSYKRVILVIVYSALLFAIILNVNARQNERYTEDVTDNYGLQKNSVKTYTYLEEVELPCRYVNDENVYDGEQYVSQPNKTGLKEITVMVTYDGAGDGCEKVIDQKIIEPACAKVVHIGTREKPEYILPVDNYILSSEFGPRWGTMHCGIDLAVPTGTKVEAAADGRVIQSGWNGGYGISVCIEHKNGSVTRYGHMSEALAHMGDFVKQGEVIGLSGSTGDSTGPHVHFEIRINDEPVNPLDYVEEESKSM